jgi:hypothetical protein
MEATSSLVGVAECGNCDTGSPLAVVGGSLGGCGLARKPIATAGSRAQVGALAGWQAPPRRRRLSSQGVPNAVVQEPEADREPLEQRMSVNHHAGD